jgi:hypothetical protein
MGPARVDVFLLSPEDGNRYTFRTDVFSSNLELLTMEKSTNSVILNMFE